MIGIDVAVVNKIIYNLDDLEKSINKNVNNIVNTFDDFKNVYSGNDIKFLFTKQSNNIENFMKISSVIKSYTETLNDIVFSYKRQQQSIMNALNKIN